MSLPFKPRARKHAGTIDTHEIGALLARGLTVWNGLLRSLPGVSGGRHPNLARAAHDDPMGASTERGECHDSKPRWSDAADPSSQGQLYAAAATDSLAEINVKTSNYQAEYGQSAGAVINLTTRAGTKQFHGGIYTYLRNEDLNANDYFNNLEQG